MLISNIFLPIYENNKTPLNASHLLLYTFLQNYYVTFYLFLSQSFALSYIMLFQNVKWRKKKGIANINDMSDIHSILI